MNFSHHSAKQRPQRTCLACRQIKAKQELVRLVRIADEHIEVDIGKRKAGRGAYLCPSPECWESGLKGTRLEHSLKTKLTPDNREELISFGQGLFKSQDKDRTQPGKSAVSG